jgi:AraC-like DNA-binding protein
MNTYRVEEFKRLVKMHSKRNLTLLALSRLAGFNSKTSFNNVFKKSTGKTPSDFCKELTNLESPMKNEAG